jgi:transposase
VRQTLYVRLALRRRLAFNRRRFLPRPPTGLHRGHGPLPRRLRRDRAGRHACHHGAQWRRLARPAIRHGPPNVTLVPLPAYSSELNPVERIWLYLRERYLFHRLLADYDAVVDA